MKSVPSRNLISSMSNCPKVIPGRTSPIARACAVHRPIEIVNALNLTVDDNQLFLSTNSITSQASFHMVG
jgi:hypothetical protein